MRIAYFGRVKSGLLCGLLIALAAVCSTAQSLKQNYACSQYKAIPQMQSKHPDTVRDRMPVLKTDTAHQAPMPVVKPPANIRPK